MKSTRCCGIPAMLRHIKPDEVDHLPGAGTHWIAGRHLEVVPTLCLR